MKKTRIVIALLGCILLVGCSSGVSNEQYESVVAERDKYKAALDSTGNEPESQEQSNAEEKIEENADKKPKLEESDYLNQLEIKEYSYLSSGDYTYYFMVVKNNSNETLKLEANITAKDESGKLIGAQSMSQEAVESGYSVCMYTTFDEGIPSTFEYSMSAKPDDYFKPVLSDIKSEITQTEKKVIISCTNEGKEAAQFVEARALFFKENTLVYSGSIYCTDDDSELKPGSTIIKEIDSYEEFDTVGMYLSGRR